MGWVWGSYYFVARLYFDLRTDEAATVEEER